MKMQIQHAAQPVWFLLSPYLAATAEPELSITATGTTAARPTNTITAECGAGNVLFSIVSIMQPIMAKVGHFSQDCYSFPLISR
jgi:hypothetical protein